MRTSVRRCTSARIRKTGFQRAPIFFYFSLKRVVITWLFLTETLKSEWWPHSEFGVWLWGTTERLLYVRRGEDALARRLGPLGEAHFPAAVKKGGWGWEVGVGVQVCTGQTGSPRIPAPPLARGGGISLEVRAAALFFHRAEVTEVIRMSPKHTSICVHTCVQYMCVSSHKGHNRETCVVGV